MVSDSFIISHLHPAACGGILFLSIIPKMAEKYTVGPKTDIRVQISPHRYA